MKKQIEGGDPLKKTFRFSSADQANLEVIMNYYNFKTENQAIQHVLNGFMAALETIDQMGKDLRQLRGQHGHALRSIHMWKEYHNRLMAIDTSSEVDKGG